jgi:cell division septal protein FtsQ
MQKRGSTLTSSKFARKRRTRVRLFVLLCVLLAALAFWGIVLFAHLRAITIATIDIEGNQATPTADIVMLVNHDLDPSYLWFFPARNTFLYPGGRIAKDILAKWPRIESVQIRRQGLTGLYVTVVEKQPVALWCGTDDAVSILAPQCYLMDETGFLFAPAPAGLAIMASSSVSSDAPTFVEFYGPIGIVAPKTTSNATSNTALNTALNTPHNTPSDSPVGSSYLSSGEIENIMSFLSVFQKTLNIQAKILIAGGQLKNQDQLQDQGQAQIENQNEIQAQVSVKNIQSADDLEQDLGVGDCELTLLGGSHIFFNDQDNPTQIISNLTLFLQNNQFVFAQNGLGAVSAFDANLPNATSATSSVIDYIDLRYGTNVYYKTR